MKTYKPMSSVEVLKKMTSAVPVTVTVNNESLSEELWAEASVKDSRYEEEEQKGNVTDEGELEADWLSDVGFAEWTHQWRQGKSLPENDIAPAVQKLSLKPHQADAVRRRVRTLNATLKKKKRRPPDVRSFFQTEIPEHKNDSSRSATPDSIGSQELSDSPPRRSSTPTILGGSRVADELDVPNFVSIFNEGNHSQGYHSQSSPPQKQDIFKQRFPGKLASTDAEIATDDTYGIKMLNFHNVGTVYIRGYMPQKRLNPSAFPSPSPCSLPSHFYQEASKHNGAHDPGKNGFMAELNRSTGSDPQLSEMNDLIEDTLTADPCGSTKLSDLSDSDIKSVRPLLLMELTAQCDQLGIQLRKRKNNKASKKEDTGRVFGVPLDMLLNKDRQVTGDQSLEVPIVLYKLLGHLSKKFLSMQGLLRVQGQKAKTNELRATFESSLYTEPEQVDEAMNQCSPHDVANLLKQFLRELPIPLLGYEYIDAFSEICDELKEKNQETCLRLLILLLPLSHQAVLRMLMNFLRDLVRNSETNLMDLHNVSVIVAPNLFPAQSLGSQNKALSRTVNWVRLTKTLIRYGPTLYIVPSDLISQLRQINDRARAKKQKGKNAISHSNKIMNASGHLSFNRKGSCSCLTVSAPQLGFPAKSINVDAGKTARDVVLELLEEADKKAEFMEKENYGNQVNGAVRKRPFQRTQEGGHNGPNLSCLLTKSSADVALKTHALYELGGNIGYRRIDPDALLPAICRENPNASWILHCNHRHSNGAINVGNR